MFRFLPRIRRLTTGLPTQLDISDSALRKLKSLSPKILQIQIDTGGCHGFQYEFSLLDEIPSTSVLFQKENQKVVVDEVSLSLLEGSRLEYVDELIGSSFQIIGNPKAESSCGCKISFNIKDL